MEDGESCFIGGVGEVGIELREQAAGAKRLVDDCGIGERTDVDCGLLPLELLARQEEAAIKLCRMRRDQRLQDAGRGGQRLLAQMLRTRGNLTPGHQPTTLRFERLFECFLRRSGIAIGREEANANGERAIGFQREARGAQQETARYLRHDADAVAALAVGGYCSAMREAAERRECVGQHLVRRLIRDARDKSDAAGIVMKARVYKGILERTL